MIAPMRLHLAVSVFAFATVGTSLTSRIAFAQADASSSGVKMAQDLVEEGRALGQQKKWGDALERFQRAASLSRKLTPQLAFYIGFAESRVGKLVAADVDLRRAIDLARDANNEQVARAAQAELPGVEARTPALTLTVNGTAPPTSLQIDGAALGIAAIGNAVPLDPGDHTVVVQFAGGPVRKQITLVERQRLAVAIDAPDGTGVVSPPLTPAPTPTPVVPPPSTTPAVPPPAEPSDGSSRRLASLVVVGVGGAALVTSGIFYLLSRSAFSPVKAVCPSGECNAPNRADLQSDYDDAKSKQTISIVFGAVGAGVAATGLILYATGGHSTETPAAASASAQFAPWMAPGGGGAVLSGHF
jgi:hypothetical protein